MNYIRFTNDEKRIAFNMAGGYELKPEEGGVNCYLSKLYRKDPSKIIKNPDVYAELYFPSYTGSYFDSFISDLAIAFYKYGDGKINCDVIYRIKGADYWVSGKVVVFDKFVKQLNASIYGEYDSKHIKELAIRFFFADANICVHMDEHSVIHANRGGLELFTKGKDKPDCLAASKFIPYEYFNPVSFRNIYSKINKNLRDFAALNAKENTTDGDKDELIRIVEGLCDDKEVNEFFNTYDLEKEIGI